MNLTLGEKIRLFRKRANLSQVELAKRIGLQQVVLSRIENSQKANVKTFVLVRILKVLDLTFDQLTEDIDFE